MALPPSGGNAGNTGRRWRAAAAGADRISRQGDHAPAGRPATAGARQEDSGFSGRVPANSCQKTWLGRLASAGGEAPTVPSSAPAATVWPLTTVTVPRAETLVLYVSFRARLTTQPHRGSWRTPVTTPAAGATATAPTGAAKSTPVCSCQAPNTTEKAQPNGASILPGTGGSIWGGGASGTDPDWTLPPAANPDAAVGGVVAVLDVPVGAELDVCVEESDAAVAGVELGVPPVAWLEPAAAVGLAVWPEPGAADAAVVERPAFPAGVPPADVTGGGVRAEDGGTACVDGVAVAVTVTCPALDVEARGGAAVVVNGGTGNSPSAWRPASSTTALMPTPRATTPPRAPTTCKSSRTGRCPGLLAGRPAARTRSPHAATFARHPLGSGPTPRA